jgi:multiple sugar transport system substrate-binding protein
MTVKIESAFSPLPVDPSPGMSSTSRGLPRRTLLRLAASSGLSVAGAWATDAAAAPQQLVVAAYPLLDEIVRAALPAWKRRHPGVEVQVITRQYTDHHTAMTTALSTAVRLPDVMALEASFLGRFAPGRGLDDLAQPPFHADRLRSRWVPYAYDQAVNARGEVVAAPTDIGPGTLLYRTDLLAKAGLTEADLTRSWEAYIDAGLKLKAATGARLISHARIVKDILIRSGLKPGEGLYFDRESRVLVNSPRFVRAFELARRVRRNQLDARVSAWTNDWAESFKRGTLATELSGAWMVGQMADQVAPQTQGLWRAAQLPEGTFVSYGGSYYAIPRKSAPERKALAWDLIQWLTLDRETQFAAFKSQDAFPSLLETLDDPFFEQPLPFLGGQRARLLWREAARRITATPAHKQNFFADEVVNTELDNVLDRGKDIAQALADTERLLARRAHR